MAATGKPSLKLFLEGIEIPVVSSVVTSGVNRPATAAIRVPPSDEVNELLPRTLLHLFYYDVGTWRLLFCGELQAVQYVKGSSARSAILQAVDFSTYMDSAKKYYYEELSWDYQKKQTAAFTDTRAEMYSGIDSSPTASIMRLLQTPPTLYPGLKGLMGGVVHLIESIGGFFQNGPKSGVNDFFSAAQLRLKLIEQIGVSPEDLSSQKLLDSSEFRKWLKATVSRSGNMVSLRNIFDVLLKKTFHDYVSITAPCYTEEYEYMSWEMISGGGDPWRYAQDRFNSVNKLLTTLDEQDELAASELAATKIIAPIEIPLGFSGESWEKAQELARQRQLVDNLNKRVEDKHRSKHYAWQAVKEGWQLAAMEAEEYEKAKKEFSSEFVKTKNESEKLAKAKNEIYKSYPYPEDTFKNEAVTTLLAAGDKSVRDAFEKPWAGYDEDEWGILRFDVKNFDEFTEIERHHLEDAKEYYSQAIEKAKPVYGWVKRKIPRRLVTTIIRPDIFFCPPPRCNVIFPDEYISFEYARDFFSEPTRLMVTSESEWSAIPELAGLGMNLKHSYFAPDIPSVKGIAMSKQAARSVRFLMPHEKFSGIIPELQWVPDLREYDPVLDWEANSIYQTMNKQSRGPSDKVPYMQHITDFMFFRSRYINRTASINSLFRPKTVAGMPMFIVDKYYANLQNKETKPVGHLGMPIELTHSIGQEGASTAITLVLMRNHKEAAEFIKPEKSRKLIGTKRVTKKCSWTGLSQIKGGKIISVEITGGDRSDIAGALRLINSKIAIMEAASKRVPGAAVIPTGTGTVPLPSPTAIGIAVLPASTTAPALAVLPASTTTAPLPSVFSAKVEETLKNILNTAVPVTGATVQPVSTSLIGAMATLASAAVLPFAEFEVAMEVGEYLEEEFKKPFEEVARPAWFAPIYKNEYIGDKFYKLLIGCGSIVDPHKIEIAVDNESGEFAAIMSKSGYNVDWLGGTQGRVMFKRTGEKGLDAGVPSIEEIADDIIAYYSAIKAADYGASKFVDQFTQRNIATLQEVLGSDDLMIKTVGNKLEVTGTEGFHSRAFGMQKNMFDLSNENFPYKSKVSDSLGTVPPLALDDTIDPRAERRQRAESYQRNLLNRSLIG